MPTPADDDSYATLRPDRPLRGKNDAAKISEPPHADAQPPTTIISQQDLPNTDFAAEDTHIVPTATSSPPTQSLKPGSRFGDYEVIEEIDRGGMGIVLKAQQITLNRVVAIKMILTGSLAGESDVKRFYTEAEASAELDHPYIVPIYEIGKVDGLHFYSMRYVDGPSLAARVVSGPLEVDEAATLAQQIAEAVGYAHDRGIIHRDLKPANVLLDRGVEPLITDFGLAKRLDDDQGLTGTGQVMGTPGYMPPEQAMGNVKDINRSSDIYSVGAILYCLLTGRAPFQAASVIDTLSQVVRNEPVAPRQLNPAVPLDLETICLKCLAKQPGQRYASAHDLAADLARYIDGRPVHARPVGPLRRFGRWCKRNPVVAGLSMAAVASLIVGTVVSTVFAFEAATRAREAEANFKLARTAVDEYFTQVSDNTLLNQPGMQPLQQQLLRQALTYYEKFVIEHSDDPAIQDDLAGASFRVGLINETIEDDPETAIAPLTAALKLQEELLSRTPNNPERQKALADTLTALGRIQFRHTGPDSALATLQRALRIRQQIAAGPGGSAVEIQRVVANAQMNVGLVLMNLGQFEQAARLFELAQSMRNKVLTVAEDARVRRDLGMGFYNLGNLSLNDPDAGNADAYHHFEAAIKVFRGIMQAEPQNFANQSRLALCYRILGDLQSEAEDSGPALLSYAQALESLRHVVNLNPSVTQYRDQLADLQMNHGQLLFADGMLDEAFRAFLDAREILEARRETENDVESESRYAVVLREIGLIEIEQGQVQDGLQKFDQAEAIQRKLVSDHPGLESLQLDLEDTLALRPDTQPVRNEE